MPRAEAALRAYARRAGRVLVAYSGGVDSGVLAYFASRYAPAMLTVTCSGPLYPAAELAAAQQLAQTYGFPHLVKDCDDLAVPAVRNNAPDRCYHCKYARFAALLTYAKEQGYTAVWDGSNTDDLQGYRPGLRALQELGISSPYLELGIDKATVRELAARYVPELATKPAAPCLATRFPYHTQLTPAALARAAAAEALLLPLLGSPLRVRVLASTASVETPLPPSPDMQAAISKQLQTLGFTAVHFDRFCSGRFDKK
ncbi:MAG: asparagine synthase-related protein [Veillonellaceae bacterium]|nr:asparagine synthase-related protein [Veillonellaceae bacterium]